MDLFEFVLQSVHLVLLGVEVLLVTKLGVFQLGTGGGVESLLVLLLRLRSIEKQI